MEEEFKNSEKVPVLIIGAGPTGLSLALGLARQQIPSVLIEKNPNISETSKAPGIHVRTREIFRKWGIEQQVLRKGNLVQHVQVQASDKNKILFSADFRKLEDEAVDPGILILEQGETESILLQALRSTGKCDIRFEAEAKVLENFEDRVEVTVKEEERSKVMTAQYVVGCDGAGSFVRHALELPFDGFTYSIGAILADVHIRDERNEKPWPRFYNGKAITIALNLGSGLWRLIRLQSKNAEDDEKVNRAQVREMVEEVLGPGEFRIEWANPFKIHRRSSPKFRIGRVLLAGDAAHVHSPAGGQGMNAGIQDADNLAWKLAACILGANAGNLLNSYETERKAVVVKDVSSYTDFITRTFLQAPLVIRSTAFYMLRRILSIEKFHKKFLRRTGMIDLDYEKSEILLSENKAAGKRLPNILLFSGKEKPVRIYDVLPEAPSILSIGNNDVINLNLPVIELTVGAYSEPYGIFTNFLKGKEGFILIRPDRHIAWAGDDPAELERAVKHSFGGKI